MEKEIKINNIAYIPLAIFITNLLIYLLIDKLEIINIYSGLAKNIYIFISFPINIIGSIIFLYFSIKFLTNYKRNYWNLILCIPLLIFLFYFYFIPLL